MVYGDDTENVSSGESVDDSQDARGVRNSKNEMVTDIEATREDKVLNLDVEIGDGTLFEGTDDWHKCGVTTTWAEGRVRANEDKSPRKNIQKNKKKRVE